MKPLPRPAMIAALVALTFLLGIGDYATGVETTFTLLYLFPIAAATWYVDVRLGVALSVLAGVWETAELIETSPRVLFVVWNEAGVLAIYLVLLALIARLRSYVEAEQRERRLVIEQLRHADRLNVIGTLAAGVAHELGTPLNVISGSAELLVDSRKPEDVEELSKVIREQATRIGDIVRHLLEFGRRGGTGRVAVDLNEAAHATVELLASTARKRDAQLDLVPATQPVVVQANRSELQQVLSNLILNALQAMPAGGTVRVRVDTAGRTSQDGQAREFGAIAVEDAGAGITPADLPRIFDPFFTTKGVGEGTGLGLSVSYGIVQDHGGFIDVDSRAGEGSKFTVMLPRG
jgi:two-component system NtrC family sensor kinase